MSVLSDLALAPELQYQFSPMENLNFKKISLSILAAAVSQSTISGAAVPVQKNELTDFQYAVNMQDGGLIVKESFKKILSFDRTYRSRSVQRGFFGMGWCSPIESQLQFQGKGLVRLYDCASSKPVVFKLTQTASAYVNETDPEDRIVIKLGFYERQIRAKTHSQFDFKGRLISFVEKEKTIKLLYNQRNLPERILFGDKVVSLRWHPVLELVEKVKSQDSTLLFKYDGFNLIEVIHDSMQTQYAYDDLDNLTRRQLFVSGKKSSDELKISYDREEDRVSSIQGQCREAYRYTSEKEKKISTVSRLCDLKVSKTEFEFQTHKPVRVSSQKVTEFDRVSLNQGGFE